VLLACGFSAFAGTITVNGVDEPWDPSLQLPSYSFTNGGASGPAIVDSGVSFAPGGQILIEYMSGFDYTNINQGLVDGNGYIGQEEDSTDPNGAPADDISGSPIYLQEVLGAFTDAGGVIVGTPFVVGDGVTVTVPTGATQLELGVNDTFYNDNGDANEDQGGPLQYEVTNATTASVPEPGTFLLIASPLGLFFVVRRLRARA